MIIAVLNPKGGSGKSTLTTNLARALQLDEQSALIVDTDPQGTVRDWQAMQDERTPMPPVISVDAKRLNTDLERLALAYDVVLIDGTAKMMQGLGFTVKVADIILIPIQPSGADLWAVAGLAELINTRQQIHRGLPRAAFVVSRQIPGSNLAAEIEDALREYKLPVLKTRIAQRVIYAEALSQGATVFDLETDTVGKAATVGKAMAEIQGIKSEMLAMLSVDVEPEEEPAQQEGEAQGEVSPYAPPPDWKGNTSGDRYTIQRVFTSDIISNLQGEDRAAS